MHGDGLGLDPARGLGDEVHAGSGAALVALILFVLILGITIVQTRLGRRYEWL